MDLPINGPAYQLPMLSANSQRCVNMYPMEAGPGGRGPSLSVPTAGTQLLIDLVGYECRSLITVGDYVYAVVDDNVYKLTINYLTLTTSSSLLGTLGTSSGIVKAAYNPTQIVWVDGSATGYIYTPASGTFATINSSDADFPGGSDVLFLDSYFVVSEPDTGRFYVSANNDGTSWDPADLATAESSPDNLVALGVYKGELWLFGDQSVEIWYNAANVSGSPFSARVGLTLPVGCKAAGSVVYSDNFLFWLDSRGYIVKSELANFIRSSNTGYDLKVISDQAITAEILSYNRIDDAIGMSYNDRGHIMYQITFPDAQKTWVYDTNTGAWHERSYYNDFTGQFEHHFGQFYTKYESLDIIAGVRDGKIYVQSPDYLDDDGDEIYRIRQIPVIFDNNQFGLIGVDELGLRCESGLAPQGQAAVVSLRYSNDGGHTWSSYLDRSLGEVGEYAKCITWNRLGTAREWVFEFSITDPINFALINAYIKTTVEQ